MAPYVELTADERLAILAMDEESLRCECGWLVDKHPPMRKFGKLRSWQAIRQTQREQEPGDEDRPRPQPMSINRRNAWASGIPSPSEPVTAGRSGASSKPKGTSSR